MAERLDITRSMNFVERFYYKKFAHQKLVKTDEKETKNLTNKKRYAYQLKTNRQYAATVDQDALREAIMMAENPELPQREHLYMIYKEVYRDLHLKSQIRTAILNVLCEPWAIVDKKTKVIDQSRTELLQKQWFTDAMVYFLEAEFWGHSLMELGVMEENTDPLTKDLAAYVFKDITLIDREHVRPEWGELLLTPWSTKGIPYREEPFNTWLIEAGNPRDLGLLQDLGVDGIYKRFTKGDWSVSSEKWSDPILVIKSSSDDDAENDKKEEFAKNLGRNRYALVSKDDELELLQSNSSSGNSHNIYKDFAAFLNDELSKGTNGQSATSDQKSFVGAAEVQERQMDKYTMFRQRSLVFWLNDILLPKIQGKGYDLEGYGFVPLRILHEKAEVDDPNKKEDEEEDPQTGKPKKPLPPGGTGAKKSGKHPVLSAVDTLHIGLKELYACTCGEEHHDQHHMEYDSGWDIDAQITAGIERLYERKKKAGQIDGDITAMNASIFYDAIKSEYDTDTKDFLSARHKLMLQLRHNVAVTAVFKNYKNQLEMVSKLFDADGNLVSKAKFMKAVRPIAEIYNKNYLDAEYDTIKAAARSASQWQDFKDRGGMLQYFTIGDGRVRDEHKVMHGMCADVDDPVWDIWYPPNGWRCRCYVRWRAPETPRNIPASFPEIPAMFKNNPGKTGVIFNAASPYFSNMDLVKNADKFFGQKMPIGPVKIDYNQIRFEDLKKDPNFKLTMIDNQNGGFVYSHLNASKKEATQLAPLSRILAGRGDVVEINERFGDRKSPDLRVNGIPTEVKTIHTSTSNAIDKALQRGAKQANHLILQIDASVDAEMLEKAIYDRMQRTSNLEMVEVVWNGKIITLTRDEVLAGTFWGKIK